MLVDGHSESQGGAGATHALQHAVEGRQRSSYTNCSQDRIRNMLKTYLDLGCNCCLSNVEYEVEVHGEDNNGSVTATRVKRQALAFESKDMVLLCFLFCCLALLSSVIF